VDTAEKIDKGRRIRALAAAVTTYGRLTGARKTTTVPYALLNLIGKKTVVPF
jgi:hypothetical protein